MEKEKICFVSMPFGKKADPYTGRQFDFDKVYTNLVLPAAADAGYQAVRVDEFVASTILRPLLEQIITSDVFIADLTTANPNVMYELGLRHALSNGATVLVMASGTRLPFDVSFARAILYKVDDSGNLIEERDTNESQTSTAPTAHPLWRCPKCGGPMVVVERFTAAQKRSPRLPLLDRPLLSHCERNWLARLPRLLAMKRIG